MDMSGYTAVTTDITISPFLGDIQKPFQIVIFVAMSCPSYVWILSPLLGNCSIIIALYTLSPNIARKFGS